MLPIFSAFSIEQAPIKGGSTFPCLLSVVDENGVIKPPHVVKIFKPTHRNATCREVFANVLAQQFDLQVPAAALVNVGIEILAELKKLPAYASSQMEPGYYFGTEMLENALDYSNTLYEGKVDNWNPEMIFAFDVFIRNTDRRVTKPNFFLKDNVPVLIDHELSLNITKTFKEYVDKKEWRFIPSTEEVGARSGHVFYTHLRKKGKKHPLDFGVFLEYLRVLDVNIISQYERQLSELECYEENYIEIVNYLKEVKQNEGQFYSLLQDLLI